ncbi:tRNA pseudouridine(55) synthase TruB [Lederbergia graminis]|uniref:tRNA pseudouridine synthase B n=1 Tax=Lederbergia graminis TaxID=735518 RepID=A0ABW0LEH5_9BACI
MDGIIPLWKPRGMTSHDCVFKIRKILKMKKVGHTGTLDPEVDGVLPICIGRATKVAKYITDAGKEYIGEVTIGYSTTTEDAHGEIVESKKIENPISIQAIKNVLQTLTGEIEQTPPMYSAVKVNGKKLYEYARAGITVERPTRKVHIYQISLDEDSIKMNDGKCVFSFRVKCSKGTYIRTLAVTIGEKLGYPAHMSKLTRIASASFTSEHCLSFEDIEKFMLNGELMDNIYPLETGISYLPKYILDDSLVLRIKNGAVLPKPVDWPDGHVVMEYNSEAFAIYQLHPNKENVIKPVKILRNT